MNTGVPQHISAFAPVRVCDVGGWTDTWFAKSGFVCSIAINRGVYVSIDAVPSTTTHTKFHVHNYQQILSLDEARQHHPLLAVALDETPLPTGYAYTIAINSDMPPGSSTGTSASVSVALLAALAACNQTIVSAHTLAKQAHRLETVHLSQQSGVQDQIGAAFGGANFITITNYPDTRVEHIDVDLTFTTAFNQQHVLFYYGKPHRSSDIHQQVIDRINFEQSSVQALEPMRQAALTAAIALKAGDLRGFAMSLINNTEAQSQLHPELISDTARQIISIARHYGAWGWKVNGAGGDGGSISIIASNNPQQQQLMHLQLAKELPHIVRIDSEFCPHGVLVTLDSP